MGRELREMSRLLSHNRTDEIWHRHRHRSGYGPPTTGGHTKGEQIVQPLRYSINVTLDGCCDHQVPFADEELHRHHATNLERASALLFGRVTYEMMEQAWRKSPTGSWPEWMDDWMIPFAEVIDGAKKYVVSTTLDEVDWNAELLPADLEAAVRRIKEEPGDGIALGGLTLPLAMADLGLIDEYEFVVLPVLAGHGPTLFAGLHERIDLELVDRQDLRSGAVVLSYRPSQVTA